MPVVHPAELPMPQSNTPPRGTVKQQQPSSPQARQDSTASFHILTPACKPPTPLNSRWADNDDSPAALAAAAAGNASPTTGIKKIVPMGTLDLRQSRSKEASLLRQDSAQEISSGDEGQEDPEEISPQHSNGGEDVELSSVSKASSECLRQHEPYAAAPLYAEANASQVQTPPAPLSLVQQHAVYATRCDIWGDDLQVQQQEQQPQMYQPEYMMNFASMPAMAIEQQQLQYMMMEPAAAPVAPVVRFMPPPPPPPIALTVLSEYDPARGACCFETMGRRWFDKLQLVQPLFIADEDKYCPLPPDAFFPSEELLNNPGKMAAAVDQYLAVFRKWTESVKHWWLSHFEHMQKRKPMPLHHSAGRSHAVMAPANEFAYGSMSHEEEILFHGVQPQQPLYHHQGQFSNAPTSPQAVSNNWQIPAPRSSSTQYVNQGPQGARHTLSQAYAGPYQQPYQPVNTQIPLQHFSQHSSSIW